MPRNTDPEFAARLRASRRWLKLTRVAVADATGIPYSSLDKYESGVMSPDICRFKVLCAHYDVRADWVLYGDIADE